MHSLPIFFQRATLMNVDDDHLFLNAVAHMAKSNFHTHSFNSPAEALTFLNDYTPPSKQIAMLTPRQDQIDYTTDGQKLVEINFSALHDMTREKKLKDEISVMMIDYNMPGMKGTDVCTKLKHLPMKKILLTGELEYQEAVKAFNNGIIDRFIRKESPTLAEEIASHVNELSLAYFREQSVSLLSHLEAESPSPLSDSVFVQFFQNWCRENQVVSYALLDVNGSMHVTDKEGEQFIFLMHTDRSLGEFAELNDDVDTAAPFLSDIANRTHIPFFGLDKACWHYETSEWQPFFHAANELRGRENYYWAVVK